MASSASCSLPCSFLLASSSSSRRARPSLSYLDLQSCASALALLSCLWKSALASCSSSTLSRRLSRSCSRLRYLPRMAARSLASSSAMRLASSSWVASEALILLSWAT
uniref:Putative secreted protein n=1 Tax=Ixodes ricinus TaxID=34613 RepID=A0A6B0UH28_IXORI